MSEVKRPRIGSRWQSDGFRAGYGVLTVTGVDGSAVQCDITGETGCGDKCGTWYIGAFQPEATYKPLDPDQWETDAKPEPQRQKVRVTGRCRVVGLGTGPKLTWNEAVALVQGHNDEQRACETCNAPCGSNVECDPCRAYGAAHFPEPTLATVAPDGGDDECTLRITKACPRWLKPGVLAAWWPRVDEDGEEHEDPSCLACAEKKIRDQDAAHDDMWAGVEARRKANGWSE